MDLKRQREYGTLLDAVSHLPFQGSASRAFHIMRRHCCVLPSAQSLRQCAGGTGTNKVAAERVMISGGGYAATKRVGQYCAFGIKHFALR